MAGAPAPDGGGVVRVGLYSRWIDTLGGGEQTLGAFAETLGAHHDVDLITHERPDWSRFHDTLGFDLAGLPVRVVPHDPDHYRPLQEASRDYDLFVNCSYLDHVRSYARCSVLQVFFPPAPPRQTGPAPLPPATASHGVLVRPIAGLYPLERDAAGVSAWTDGHARFALPGDQPLTVCLRLASARPDDGVPPPVTLAADGRVLRSVRLPRRGSVDVQVRVPAGARFLDLRSPTFRPPSPDARPRLGVRVAGVTASRSRRVPPHRAAGLDRWTDPLRYVDAVGSYDLLLANSHFTQRWIAQRYGRASELLYPPVQVGQFAPGPKQQRIISVGRFFVEGHTKKQLEMIHAFRRMCDQGLTGWEYHLVGGTNADPRSVRYLQDCRAAARGYPVHVHADAPLSRLVELYAGSALYWNATGYGADVTREPDRFEHFGMTTVEAMASGVVPLSYARAGQPEVIDDGLSGVLFETLDELTAQTFRLIAAPALLRTMSVAAVEASATFGYDRFRANLARLLADALPELRG